MAFQVSPGVLVTERDLTTVIPAASTSIGAFVGVFTWGPADSVALVSSESQLALRFGKPDNTTATSFFTAANFLAYGIRLKLVRVVGAGARNATASGSTDIIVKNSEQYTANFGDYSDAGAFFAKYPGKMGNSLRVSVCTGTQAFKKTVAGPFTGARGSKTITAAGDLSDDIVVGSLLRHDNTNQQRKVVSVSVSAGTTTLTLERSLDKTLSGELEVKWEFADVVGGIAPGTSTSVAAVGGSKDELHVVVTDQDGVFTGVPGLILEKYVAVSKASDAKREDGSTNYYVDVINTKSAYIRWGEHLAVPEWGVESKNASFADSALDETPIVLDLSGGEDDNETSEDERMDGYDLLKDADAVDLSFIMLGEASANLAQYVVNNICEVRKDCVAFISPPKNAVVDNKNAEVKELVAFRTETQIASSYAFLDSGWKYQYDKYNDVFRWIPLNGDVAGLCARTDDTNDPWWSPAGYNRGVIKNVVRLAWSPSKFERDELYTNGINPVIVTPGQGTILFGDKTLLNKPSAFDRLNVRRLFIVLEKSIAIAARYTLFEFNDTFTREQFRNLIEPYLRSIQAKRGIYQFSVVCDDTNNGPDVIDANDFVGDIYIKPARSINTVRLNFVAVRSGVQFSEVVGKA